MRSLKVFLIGIDGATFDTLTPWMENGWMPNLRKIFKDSVSTRLRSTLPPVSAPAWVSLATGKNPGKHGIFDFQKPPFIGIKERFNSSVAVRAPTLWDILSWHNKKVCIVNVPVTYPPRPVNGVMVTGMMTPSENSEFTFPPQLKDEIEKVIGDYKIEPYISHAMSAKFLRDLIHYTRKRAELTLYLMKRYAWDFFFVVFRSMDPFQHYFWKYVGRNTVYPQKFKSLICEYLQTIDSAIGSIIGRLDSDSVFIIVSDHGFGPCENIFNLNRWLLEEGFLSVTGSDKPLIPRQKLLGLLSKLDVFGLKSRIPEKIWYNFKGKLIHSIAPSIDWQNTQAFSASPTLQGLYINLIGRNPQGSVPKEKYEDLRNMLIDRLLKLKDPASKQPIFAKVYRREEIYSGPYIHLAPDLLLIPYDRKWIISDSLSNKQVFEKVPDYTINGDHRDEGILVMGGNRIKMSTNLKQAHIVDITPTILYLMGIPIGSNMDGKILVDHDPKSVAVENYDASFSSEEESYSLEDLGLIENRLRDLGYM